jgi:hypothetical protein
MRRIVGGVLTAALQAIPTSASDMITVPPRWRAVSGISAELYLDVLVQREVLDWSR